MSTAMRTMATVIVAAIGLGLTVLVVKVFLWRTQFFVRFKVSLDQPQVTGSASTDGT